MPFHLLIFELAHDLVPFVVALGFDHDWPIFIWVESLICFFVILCLLLADKLGQLFFLQLAQLVIQVDYLDQIALVKLQCKFVLLRWPHVQLLQVGIKYKWVDIITAGRSIRLLRHFWSSSIAMTRSFLIRVILFDILSHRLIWLFFGRVDSLLRLSVFSSQCHELLSWEGLLLADIVFGGLFHASLLLHPPGLL